MKRAVVCLVAVLFTASIAKADAFLSGTLTADNFFTAYLATSPTAPLSADVLLATSGYTNPGDWSGWESFSGVTLTAGTTYYLVIAGENAGPNDGFSQFPYGTNNPAGILGNFSLGNSSFQFANGTQSLVTNTADWTYSVTTPGATSLTPSSPGANGVGPWGAIGGVSPDAQWIWANDPSFAIPNVIFETEITPVSAPTVIPEPGSLFLLGSGLTALAGFIARRRRSA